MRPLRFLRPLALSLLLASSLTVRPVAAQEASSWEPLARPGAEKGLFMQPRLLGFGSRLHLVWIGTNAQVSKPEVFHSTISGGSKECGNVRAPFFGLNKSRVRRVAIGRSRNLLGILLQRNLTQGNDAYEVLLSLSGDHGWSWGRLVEIDNFVSDVSNGTAVAIEGRDGPNRTEFAMAWSRDFGNVRLSNMDIKGTNRPEGSVVGSHVDGAMKVEVGTIGKEGFSAVFNNGTGLATAHARGLMGTVEQGVTFLRGRYGTFFTVSSSPYGPSRMAVGDGSTIIAYSTNEKSWKNDDQVGVLPFNAAGVQAESDMEEDKDLHVAMLVPDAGGAQLWYVGQTDKKWGKPEKVTTLPKDVEARGFDIGVTEDYVFLVASQGFETEFFRKKYTK